MALLLHAVHIVTQPECMVSKLMYFMERPDCPSQVDGQQLREELTKKIEEDPQVLHDINLGVMRRYVDKINKLCHQHEMKQSTSS